MLVCIKVFLLGLQRQNAPEGRSLMAIISCIVYLGLLDTVTACLFFCVHMCLSYSASIHCVSLGDHPNCPAGER